MYLPIEATALHAGAGVIDACLGIPVVRHCCLLLFVCVLVEGRRRRGAALARHLCVVCVCVCVCVGMYVCVGVRFNQMV